MRVAVLVCVTLAGVVSLVLAGSSGATPSCLFNSLTGTTTCGFGYSGAVEQWTVPADVSSVIVRAVGGVGGTGGCGPGGPDGALGGLGADLSASFPVAASAVLDVKVAADGGGTCPTNGAHAFVGGGASQVGSDGGGASSVAVDGGAVLLVAGGGGGAGATGFCGGSGAACPVPWLFGGAGGNAGAAGSPGPSATALGQTQGGGGGGGAGGSAAGGSGGTGGIDCNGVHVGQAGSMGGLGIGADMTYTGGGGGGGYYGGGSGGGGAGGGRQCSGIDFPFEAGGGGGGGGSSYHDPSASGLSTGLSDRQSCQLFPDGYGDCAVNNGIVTISYTTLSDLLAALKTSVNAVAPKSSLSKTVEKIQGYVAANNTAKACKELKTFIKQVNALAANKKKGITAAQAASLIDLANEIKQTLGC